ncbi:glycosyl hydrolase family 65 protein [Spirochaeta lutea]|uniref:glycosyl hydrolase family 65 protein n=1 Tax=Spirochaeta lutea TaxID=1480694 RepID=UPI00068C1F59|nr:glycosyl hydrolase family 65 protein [Spirochaeta lutea]
MDGWIIQEHGIPSEDQIITRGNNFLCANGFIGVRGTLEEYGSTQKTGVMINGIYDSHEGRWSEPVNLPNPLYLRVQDDQGRDLQICPSSPANHSHGIDLAAGIHWRNSLLSRTENPSAPVLGLKSQRFVSQEVPGLILQRLELDWTHSPGSSWQLTMGVDPDIWDINGPHLHKITPRMKLIDGVMVEEIQMETQERGIPIRIARHARVVEGGLEPLSPASEGRGSSPTGGLSAFKTVESPQNRLTVDVHILVSWGDREDFSRVFTDLPRLAARNWQYWEENQRKHWHHLWQASDVRISGDSEAMKALRFSLYHLLSLLPPEGEALSVPARGLSGQVYKGAIFWDTEIFMQPFYELTHPRRARSLILNRIQGLPGALKKAAQYGYRGAFYAWEAQDQGEEACTDYNITDVITGRPMRTFFREKQIHISADIVFALGNYILRTGDREILDQGGRQVIGECARFYLSRCHLRPDLNRYELLDVTGPDEYHERVHNNFFTNLMVKHCLEFALETGSLQDPGEVRLAEDVVQRLYIPQPWGSAGIIPQFDGYLTLRQVGIEEVLEGRLHPNEYLGGENGLARWTQVIKQADVVLGLYLFPQVIEDELIRANWEYYEQRTEHGSSLSATAYAGIAARIGNTQDALQYFYTSARIDLDGRAKQYVGDLYIGGTHPAAQGGAWQIVVFGFLGLQITRQGLSLDPHLPSHWREVECPLVLRGTQIRITVSEDSIAIYYRGKTHYIEPGTVLAWQSITGEGADHA